MQNRKKNVKVAFLNIFFDCLERCCGCGHLSPKKFTGGDDDYCRLTSKKAFATKCDYILQTERTLVFRLIVLYFKPQKKLKYHDLVFLRDLLVAVMVPEPSLMCIFLAFEVPLLSFSSTCWFRTCSSKL